jgi:succinoglycan biosynthesis protein ExoO
MKFSVVIAAYNASRTISAALQSCMSQTYAAFEIIVVDDASTDDTLQLVQSFSPEIKIISLKENKGVSATRNAGWAIMLRFWIAMMFGIPKSC